MKFCFFPRSLSARLSLPLFSAPQFSRVLAAEAETFALICVEKSDPFAFFFWPRNLLWNEDLISRSWERRGFGCLGFSLRSAKWVAFLVADGGCLMTSWGKWLVKMGSFSLHASCLAQPKLPWSNDCSQNLNSLKLPALVQFLALTVFFFWGSLVLIVWLIAVFFSSCCLS